MHSYLISYLISYLLYFDLVKNTFTTLMFNYFRAYFFSEKIKVK